MKPTASCEAAQLWVNMIPQKEFPEGDWRILYDVEDDSRSHFAEPRDGEGTRRDELKAKVYIALDGETTN